MAKTPVSRASFRELEKLQNELLLVRLRCGTMSEVDYERDRIQHKIMTFYALRGQSLAKDLDLRNFSSDYQFPHGETVSGYQGLFGLGCMGVATNRRVLVTFQNTLIFGGRWGARETMPQVITRDGVKVWDKHYFELRQQRSSGLMLGHSEYADNAIIASDCLIVIESSTKSVEIQVSVKDSELDLRVAVNDEFLRTVEYVMKYDADRWRQELLEHKTAWDFLGLDFFEQSLGSLAIACTPLANVYAQIFEELNIPSSFDGSEYPFKPSPSQKMSDSVGEDDDRGETEARSPNEKKLLSLLSSVQHLEFKHERWIRQHSDALRALAWEVGPSETMVAAFVSDTDPIVPRVELVLLTDLKVYKVGKSGLVESWGLAMVGEPLVNFALAAGEAQLRMPPVGRWFGLKRQLFDDFAQALTATRLDPEGAKSRARPEKAKKVIRIRPDQIEFETQARFLGGSFPTSTSGDYSAPLMEKELTRILFTKSHDILFASFSQRDEAYARFSLDDPGLLISGASEFETQIKSGKVAGWLVAGAVIAWPVALLSLVGGVTKKGLKDPIVLSVSADDRYGAFLFNESHNQEFGVRLLRLFKIREQKAQSRREKADGAQSVIAAPQAALAANSDPLESLKKLAELRDAGVITAEDFETKKNELLRRI